MGFIVVVVAESDLDKGVAGLGAPVHDWQVAGAQNADAKLAWHFFF